MNLRLSHITKEYYLDGAYTITPVKDTSLDISPGEFIIISGRSGCGKTTLLNLAAGLVKPTSGEVLLGGADINAMNEDEISTLRSQKIGFIFQFPSLLTSLTIEENVKIPANFGLKQTERNIQDRADQLLQNVGLSARKRAFPKQLSAGEQKRAVIARSLINRPQIIFADEPTSDLDVQTEKEIMALLRDIHQTGVTFLMVTHSLELIPHATRAFRMEEGVLHPLKETLP